MKIINAKSASASFMCQYNEGKREQGTAQLLLSNVVAKSADGLERVMNSYALKNTNARLKNRFAHLKISLSPNDAGLSNDTFEKIGHRVLQELGYSYNPYAIYRHLDTQHPHLHVVLSRVDFNGKLVSDSFDGMKAKKIERTLVEEFELTPSYKKLLTSKGVRLPGYAERWQMKEAEAIRKDLMKKGFSGMELEVKVSERTKDAVNSMKRFVQNTVLECMYDHPSGDIFVKRLARRGVSMVRHEFDRDGKKHYGISYHYDPEKSRVEFEAKDIVGQVAGDAVLNVALGKEYFDHAYFNEVPVRAEISQKGMPQLCLFNAAPVEPEKTVSFRAVNLGPAFMEEALNKTMKFSEEILKLITLKRKGKKDVQYPDNNAVVLKDEPKEISSLMVAAELRSPTRVQEVLRKNKGKATNFNKLDSLGTQMDLQFIEEHSKTTQPAVKEGQQQKDVVETPYVFKPVVNPLVGMYEDKFGVEPSPATRLALGYINTQNWKELNDLITSQLNRAVEQGAKFDMIDERILEFKPLGRDVRNTAYEYQKWMEENKGEYTFLFDQDMVKTAKATENLINALQEGDMKAVRFIIENLTPEYKKVPRTLIINAPDVELSNQLLVLGGYAQWSDLQTDKSEPKDEKRTDPANDANINKKRGLDSGLDNNADTDMDNDTDSGLDTSGKKKPL